MIDNSSVIVYDKKTEDLFGIVCDIICENCGEDFDCPGSCEDCFEDEEMNSVRSYEFAVARGRVIDPLSIYSWHKNRKYSC